MKDSRLLCLLLVVFLTGISCESPKFIAEIQDYRDQYKKKFQTDSHAPLKDARLDSMRFFSPNSNYRAEAYVTLIKNGDILSIPTSSGTTKQFQKYASLEFKINGIAQKLICYQNLGIIEIEQYKDHLFLPFKDLTNGETTYGGGRYLDLSIGDITANIILLDFNKCYNPYCHYSSGYNCPIPPFENHLEIPIKAGEKKYIGNYILGK